MRNRKIILKYSFFLMAVMLVATLSTAIGQTKAPGNPKPKVQIVRIHITNLGYEPASIRLRRRIPARITFLRTTDATCATEVVFHDYRIRRELPLNQPVTISLTPRKTGEVAFTCGMNMMRGTLIVR